MFLKILTLISLSITLFWFGITLTCFQKTTKSGNYQDLSISFYTEDVLRMK